MVFPVYCLQSTDYCFLARWPVKNPPAHHVDVQMENCLPAPRAVVDYGSVAFRFNLALASQLGRNREKMSEKGFVLGCRYFQRRHVFSRDHQEMNGRLGMQIFEGHYRFIFKNNFSRDRVFDDATKNAIFQVSLPKSRES